MRARRITDWLAAHFTDRHFLWIWTALNLFQIAFTELTSDEGYYWFWSTALEWGYYEHPPLLPLLMRAGGAVFEGEFGVRLCNVLLMSIGLAFFLRTMPRRSKPCAYVILFGLPLLGYITFVAFPDSPLVGLSGIALYVYKRYLEKDELRTALLLAVLVALMFYAKYHAILFVFFTLLSNPGLLRRRNVQIAGVVAALLYVPHLWWQHTNGYPSVEFHLHGRSSGVFYWDNLFDFLWQQFFVIGVGLVWVPFVQRAGDAYERALKYVAIGTLCFFLLGTLRGFVHLHWTAIALLPIVYLGAGYYATRTPATRFALLVWPNILLMLALRIYLAFPVVATNVWTVDYYHRRPLWAEDVHAIGGGRPVVFETGHGALRQAPLYQFYSGGWSMALYPGERKKSQYQIWHYEDRVQGKPVLLISGERPGMQASKTRMGDTVYYRKIDSFVSYSNIAIRYDVGDGDVVQGRRARLHVVNHRAEPLVFRPNQMIYIAFGPERKPSVILERTIGHLSPVPPRQEATLEVELRPEEITPGTYSFIVGIYNPYTLPSVSSERGTWTIGAP